MYVQRTKTVIVGLVWFVGQISFVGAEPPTPPGLTLPEQVSVARAAVDTLAENLQSHRRSVRDELGGLRAERAELQRRVRLEQIRRDTLAKLFEERTKRVDDQEGRMLTLLAPIKRAVTAAQAYVRATMPFKRDERMRLLARIEADLSVTHPDVSRALTRLWRFVEEEEAMAREIGLVQQVIEVDGKRLLADVVRIGMALMYFRLPNGEMGWVVRENASWQFKRIEAPEPRRIIGRVFNDLEKSKVLGPKQLLISTELPAAQNRAVQ